MAGLGPDRPNVLVFFTDQQRHDTTGGHGNPMGLTPVFDRVSRRGTHVRQSYTCQPVCGPARSCLQTGLYATQTGCWRNGIPLRQDLPTLAHWFTQAGYRTGYIGKWHLGEKLAGTEAVPQAWRGGYDFWLAANALEHSSDAYRCEVYDRENRRVLLPGYRVDALTDAAIRFVDDHQRAHPRDPFFLFLSFLEPHHQNHRDDYPGPTGEEQALAGSSWCPPDLAMQGGSARRHLPGYYAMVRRLDQAFGRLLDALESLGARDDTIVLFTSDHACHFRTRNGEYKRSCHDASIRVPTLLAGPGFDGGGELDVPVSLVDLVPTLLDGAGLPVPGNLAGRSIVPLLGPGAEARAARARWPGEAFVQISESQTGRAIRTSRWTYSVRAPAEAVTGGSASVYDEEFLYDNLADPWQMLNLIDQQSHAELCDRLRARLLARMQAAGEAAPQIRPAARRPAGQRLVEPHELDL